MMWRLVVALAFLSRSSADMTCKNESGHAVDWFILYKAANSYAYFYIDDKEADWGSRPINDNNGCLGMTLEPYTNTNSVSSGFIAYSDQPPQGSAGQQHGHSKGLIMMDKTNIVWLLHSTPKFPFDQSSFYPPSGKTNAQTFICVTFMKKDAPKIAKHLWYIYPKRFEVRTYPDYDDLFKDDHKVPNTTSDLYQDLTSSGGKTFRSFVKKVLRDDAGPSSAKKPKNNNAPDEAEDDLYVTIAEETADKHVVVQTWGRQRGRAPSYCVPGRKHVHNVNSHRQDAAFQVDGTPVY
ncbi:uncharacterized protein V6R79_001239 [Siganus canaliculatus]